MPHLAQQRCFNHVTREAVARCPECAQYFCRECITEHHDRVICSACLRKLGRAPSLRRSRIAGALRVAQCCAGFFAAWFFFYFIGSMLVKLPTSFHEETLRRVSWMDQK